MNCRALGLFRNHCLLPQTLFRWMSPQMTSAPWSCDADQNPQRDAFWHYVDWFQGLWWYTTQPHHSTTIFLTLSNNTIMFIKTFWHSFLLTENITSFRSRLVSVKTNTGCGQNNVSTRAQAIILSGRSFIVLVHPLITVITLTLVLLMTLQIHIGWKKNILSEPSTSLKKIPVDMAMKHLFVIQITKGPACRVANFSL